MQYAEFDGINSFLVGISKILLKEGVQRNTRGQMCYEIPNPVMFKIKNPLSRIVTLPERKWNVTLPYVESLWLASGRNDMEMVGHYVEKLFDFSDDKKTMRGGYGPRLRFFNGIADDYKKGYLEEDPSYLNTNIIVIDQFEFIAECFKKDSETRQAIISIADPAKDCFSVEHTLKKTKDFPCTRSLHFQKNGQSLDLIVHMRSNDFIWGASGVNIFNFTFIQEYFAQILNLKIGAYYHIADNFHYYEPFKKMLEELAEINVSKIDDSGHVYKKTFNNLNEFELRRKALQVFEEKLRKDESIDLIKFDDDFFDDWASVFYVYHTGDATVTFANKSLGQLAKKRITKRTIASNKKIFADTFSIKNPGEKSIIHYWKEYI